MYITAAPDVLAALIRTATDAAIADQNRDFESAPQAAPPWLDLIRKE